MVKSLRLQMDQHPQVIWVGSKDCCAEDPNPIHKFHLRVAFIGRRLFWSENNSPPNIATFMMVYS
jgi:hypothetical protein